MNDFVLQFVEEQFVDQFEVNAGADVSLANNQSLTPLHSMVRSGNKDIIKLLLDAGADINATDRSISLLTTYQLKFQT